MCTVKISHSKELDSNQHIAFLQTLFLKLVHCQEEGYKAGKDCKVGK